MTEQEEQNYISKIIGCSAAFWYPYFKAYGEYRSIITYHVDRKLNKRMHIVTEVSEFHTEYKPIWCKIKRQFIWVAEKWGVKKFPTY